MTELKAKRRLTDISFDHEGAHVALVGKFQGGPANGVDTLLFKSASTEEISEEELEKALGKSPEETSSSVEKEGGDSNKPTEDNIIDKSNEVNPDMTDTTNTIEKSAEQVALEKANAKIAELEKAAAKADELEQTVSVLKAAEEKRKDAEYVTKASKHVHVVSEEDTVTDLAKSLRIAEETEGCEALVKAFESYRDLVENADKLIEKGASKTDDQPNSSKLDAAISKAQQEHGVDYVKALDMVKQSQPQLFNEEYKF